MPEPEEPQPGPEPARTPPPPAPETPGSFLEKAAYVTAPATVVLGLLYYFGCTYTDAYYGHLGVPANDLQLSVQAYVVKSPDAVFFPIWLLLMCGLAVLLVLGWAGRALAVPGREAVRRTVTGWLLAFGLILVLAGFPVFFWEDWLPRLPSGWLSNFGPCLVVALGATLAFFAVQMHLNKSRDELGRPARTGNRLWLAGGALLIGLLTLSLFFAVARYAAMAGQAKADRVVATGYTDESPRLIVHSSVPIPHHADAIEFNDLGRGSAPYRYQYRGFRLLAKSPSRFYLVSYAQIRPELRLVVLPDDGTVRVEISP